MDAPNPESVRVASATRDHVYIRHCCHSAASSSVVPVPAAEPLLPSWIAANAHRFDLVHRFLGLDVDPGIDPEHWVATLRAFNKQFVLTCYDFPDAPDADRIGALVLGAATVITLTPGAAAEIRRRWGRDALVLPHPHVVGCAGIAMPRPRRSGFTIGVHCASARPTPGEWAMIEGAVSAAQRLPGATVQVDIPAHAAALDGISGRLREVAGDPRLGVRLHGAGEDVDLFATLRKIDVSILPERFGMHSWWLEACHDLGTVVVAPDGGFHAEQRPCLSYRRGDHESLIAAILGAHRNRYTWQATVAERRAERRAVAQTHERVYRATTLRAPAASLYEFGLRSR